MVSKEYRENSVKINYIYIYIYIKLVTTNIYHIIWVYIIGVVTTNNSLYIVDSTIESSNISISFKIILEGFESI